MKATVSKEQGAELVELGTHRFYFADDHPNHGYCDRHETLSCVDNLTSAAWLAIIQAEETP